MDLGLEGGYGGDVAMDGVGLLVDEFLVVGEGV